MKEEKKKLVSVIIPVFQVEAYIRTCIESVRKQRYRELEIILVDDGSTDSSGKICDQYAEMDSRIRVIHQKNQGLSQARNVGLAAATGAYILFVDGDDFIHPQMIYSLLTCSVSYDAPIVMCDYKTVPETATATDFNWETEKKQEDTTSFPDVMTEYFLGENTAYTVVWNKLYKREVLESIRFPVGRKVEDEFVSYRLLYEAEKVAVQSEKFYAYRMRAESIMHQKKSDRYKDACLAYEARTRYFAEKKEERLQYLSLYQGMYWAMRFFYAAWEYDALGANWLRKWYMERYQELMEHIPEEADVERIEEMKRFFRSPEENDRWIQKRNYANYKRQVGYIRVKAREWNCFRKDYKRTVKLLWLKLCIAFGKKVKIETLEASLVQLTKDSKGIIRYGDGELSIMKGGHINFQRPDEELGKRLEYILEHPIENCYIGVLDELNWLDFENRTEHDYRYWIRHIFRERKTWMKYLNPNITYLSANISRPYIRYRIKTKCPSYFEKIQELWNGKRIVIIEGEGTRLGVGNDLFSGAKEIQRIVCPSRDAFDFYDEILQAACEIDRKIPIFLALGPTATVLGYDLCKLGYCAYDIGHVDLEYEWMRMGVAEKVKVKNKYTNEVEGGECIQTCEDAGYLSQIRKRIPNRTEWKN